jgi:rare lipoprotein A
MVGGQVLLRRAVNFLETIMGGKDVLGRPVEERLAAHTNHRTWRVSLKLTLILSLCAALTPVTIAAAVASTQSGIASVYSTDSGTATASGARLNPGAFTAAHRSLPCGSKVRVTNRKNGRAVVVTINDRGPFVRGRIIDLTPAGARALGFSGLASVTVERETTGGLSSAETPARSLRVHAGFAPRLRPKHTAERRVFAPRAAVSAWDALGIALARK